MGNREKADTVFRKNLKAERQRRGWSQADMTELLKPKGVHLAATGLTKIENGHRPVRIDEAAAIAEVFEVSLDVLTGRRTTAGADFKYSLRAMVDFASQSAAQIAAMYDELVERYRDVRLFDFDGLREFTANWGRAAESLEVARRALEKLSEFDTPADAKVTFSEALMAKMARAEAVRLMEGEK